MPFLDTLVNPKHNGTLSTRVHRNPTHADQYLQWDNQHHIEPTYCVINILNQSAKTVSFTTGHLRTEIEHIKEVVAKCKHTPWALA